jgi:hypothetical protein
MAFCNSSEMMQFFDLSGSETLRIDEFVFGVQFFISGTRLTECLMLFSKLDTLQDGLLDEIELDALFSGASGKGDIKGENYLEDTE